MFVAPYLQLDSRINYQLPILNNAVGVYVEGTNILNKKLRKYGRYENKFIYYGDIGARYAAGVRVKF